MTIPVAPEALQQALYDAAARATLAPSRTSAAAPTTAGSLTCPRSRSW